MNEDIKKFIYKIRYPILLLILLWIIEAGDTYLGLGLSVLGIYPREWSGLVGVITAPFIHSTWGHLASNSIPLISLTTILVVFYKKVASNALILIMLGSGLMVWLFGRPSYHIGASGVVFGLIGFILFTGIFKSNAKSIVLSLIVLTVYSGSVSGLFPNVEPNISWESHLFGAIVGLIVAFIFRNIVEEDEKQYTQEPSWTNESYIKQYFLPRDAFEKTKLQRYYEYLEAERLKAELEAFEKNNITHS